MSNMHEEIEQDFYWCGLLIIAFVFICLAAALPKDTRHAQTTRDGSQHHEPNNARGLGPGDGLEDVQ